AQLVDLSQDHAQLLWLVDRPILLRSEPDAGTVGAAAMVGLAIGGSRGPGRLDQLADTEARAENFRLESGNVGVGWRGSGGNRILPDQILGRNFRPEVTDLRPHVAMGQLEPGA